VKEELCNLYMSFIIVRPEKSRRLRQADHAACMTEKANDYTMFSGETSWKAAIRETEKKVEG
jgi:hypothetical protein